MFGYKWHTTLLVDGSILTMKDFEMRPAVFLEAAHWVHNHWPENAEYVFFMHLSKEKHPPTEMFGQGYDPQIYPDQWRPVELLEQGTGHYHELGLLLKSFPMSAAIMTDSPSEWMLCLKK